MNVKNIEKILDIIKNNKSNYWKILKYNHLEIYNEVLKLSGNKFSEKLYKYLYNKSGSCLECHKPTNFVDINMGYREFCSLNCLNKSNLIRDRIIKTYREKYGVDNISQLEIIKDKKKNTTLKNFGVPSGVLTPAAIGNRCRKWKEYFNSDKDVILKNLNIGKRKAFIDDCISGDRLAGKLTPMFDIHSFTNIKDETLKFRCNKCNSQFNHHLQWGTIPICRICNPTSKFEQTVYEVVISTLKLDSNQIKRNIINVIPYKELDIYIPALNIAIECNGLYWHSNKRKSKTYHLNKTKACEKRGIKLIHIFEDEWNSPEFKLLTSEWLRGKLPINYNEYYASLNNTLILNRRIYNKCYIPPNYELISEDMPKLLPTNVWDCGTLNLKLKLC